MQHLQAGGDGEVLLVGFVGKRFRWVDVRNGTTCPDRAEHPLQRLDRLNDLHRGDRGCQVPEFVVRRSHGGQRTDHLFAHLGIVGEEVGDLGHATGAPLREPAQDALSQPGEALTGRRYELLHTHLELDGPVLLIDVLLGETAMPLNEWPLGSHLDAFSAYQP